MKCDLVLVDGSYYLYRSYYASMSKNLTTPDGFPTGVLKFMTNMLHGIAREVTCPIVVVLDSRAKNFRHEIFPEYKAHRKETPEEILKQFKPMCKIMQAMGLTLVKKKGWEADDIIGTLAKEADSLHIKTMILTGDKDLAQFITPNVFLYDSLREKLTDKKALKETKGIVPRQVPSYLALCGDSSDNIPGVTGIGDKTAAALLSKYKTLKGIYEHLDELPKGQRSKLENQKDTLKLSFKLTRCDTDVPLGLHVEGIMKRGRRRPNLPELKKLFNAFNMKFMWAK